MPAKYSSILKNSYLQFGTTNQTTGIALIKKHHILSGKMIKTHSMKTLLYSVLFVSIFIACNNSETATSTGDATNEDVTKNWKLGVALWTFHTFNFPESLI